MKHFSCGITDLQTLKKVYRELTMKHHPDLGGDVITMQEINGEFDMLYEQLKNAAPSSSTETAETASAYRNSYYEEQGWTGSRAGEWHTVKDLAEIIRAYLKARYPECTFTVNKNGWSSINVHIMTTPFNPFKGEPMARLDIRRYNTDNSPLNDEGLKLVREIYDYMADFNWDHSDSYTDYFNRGFYESVEFGNDRTAFKVEVRRKFRAAGAGGKAEFKPKYGPVYKAIKKLLGSGRCFGHDTVWSKGFNENGTHDIEIPSHVIDIFDIEPGAKLGKIHIWENETHFYSMSYSQPSLVQKVHEQFAVVGIHLGRGSKIDSIDEATLAALKAEREDIERQRREYENPNDNPDPDNTPNNNNHNNNKTMKKNNSTSTSETMNTVTNLSACTTIEQLNDAMKAAVMDCQGDNKKMQDLIEAYVIGKARIEQGETVEATAEPETVAEPTPEPETKAEPQAKYEPKPVHLEIADYSDKSFVVYGFDLPDDTPANRRSRGAIMKRFAAFFETVAPRRTRINYNLDGYSVGIICSNKVRKNIEDLLKILEVNASPTMADLRPIYLEGVFRKEPEEVKIDMSIEKYSEKSFILLGTAPSIADKVRTLGGAWMHSKKAWVFSNRHRDAVEKFVKEYKAA